MTLLWFTVPRKITLISNGGKAHASDQVVAENRRLALPARGCRPHGPSVPRSRCICSDLGVDARRRARCNSRPRHGHGGIARSHDVGVARRANVDFLRRAFESSHARCHRVCLGAVGVGTDRPRGLVQRVRGSKSSHVADDSRLDRRLGNAPASSSERRGDRYGAFSSSSSRHLDGRRRTTRKRREVFPHTHNPAKRERIRIATQARTCWKRI